MKGSVRDCSQVLPLTYPFSDAVRSAKFIARKQWIVAGADDMFIRVYNYNTMDKVKAFEAHTDYIRCVAVHPSLPYVLSSSDDMLIKLWDWDKGWQCTQIFEGHSHYVMQVAFNPKDTNTFASASLDRTIKVRQFLPALLPKRFEVLVVHHLFISSQHGTRSAPASIGQRQVDSVC